MQEIKGVVESVIFRNGDNGYTVVDLDSGGTLLTAVGIFPPVGEGEQLLLTGEMKFNPRFGEQFVVESVKISPPNSAESIIKYLSSGLFKGIGEVTATAIVAKYGDMALEVIDKNPSELREIRGITPKRAFEIGESYRSNREMQEVIIYLQQFDITVNMAIKIYKIYQRNTVFVINNNPYKLVEDVDGIGFVTADKLAQRIGIDAASPFRLHAAIIYCLKENANSKGNTCLPDASLVREVLTLLSFGADRADDVYSEIKGMLVFGDIVAHEVDDVRYIMLTMYDNMERAIARRIADLIRNEGLMPFIDCSREIAEFEQMHNITLHEQQKVAVAEALNSGCLIITGGPGTGKTTIIRCILHVLRTRGSNFALCAPTGRAAKRMSEQSGAEAKTIHRMLDLCFNGNTAAFTYNENTRLDEDFIIVDEVSMCDEYVFSSLIKAIHEGGRLILLGDADQLPSVGAGNVLNDLIDSDVVKVVRLTHIYRQDEDSLIVVNAHRINEGRMPVFDNKKKDFFFIPKTDAGEIVAAVKELVMRRLPDYYNIAPRDIQVLAPMKKGIAGVINLNNALQQSMNPMGRGNIELLTKDNLLRIGDKVIHVMNNYQLEWSRATITNGKRNVELGTGVFNGDIGYVVNINKGNMTVDVEMEDGRLVTYTSDCLEQLQLAYAISVHKSQGSEFEVVVLVLSGGNYMIMTRNLLYTAVTRARNMLVIVGDEGSVSKMVRNTFCSKSHSLLTHFLLKEINK